MSTSTTRHSVLLAHIVAAGLGFAGMSAPEGDAVPPRASPFAGASRPVLVAPGLVSTGDGEYSPTYGRT